MKRKKWLLTSFVLVCVIGVIQVGRSHFREEERTMRIKVRETIQGIFSDSYMKSRAAYGLKPYLSQNGNAWRKDNPNTVILVHGLDDPGIVWKTLAPILVDQGYQVGIMTYPNDQPIKDSALFFAKELQGFVTAEGPLQVSIICHSMGGLVTREMLTSDVIGYTDMKVNRLVPGIKHFIMVGTPNHGSALSLFRIVTEIRDQVVTASKDGYQWLQSVFDGFGEAGIDLLPDSVFLKELNARPLPQECQMLVIAGVVGSLGKREIDSYFEEVQRKLPSSTQATFSQILPALKKVQAEVGDGLVSVESARLDDVPLWEVQGTHVSIIRNLGKETVRIPPAIPIILKELESPRS